MTTNAAMNIEATPPRRRLILALGRGKSGKTLIAGLIAFSKPGAPGREPLAFQRQATRLWLGRMETAFAPFSREVGLG
jgi:hypothetical protein